MCIFDKFFYDFECGEIFFIVDCCFCGVWNEEFVVMVQINYVEYFSDVLFGFYVYYDWMFYDVGGVDFFSGFDYFFISCGNVVEFSLFKNVFV